MRTFLLALALALAACAPEAPSEVVVEATVEAFALADAPEEERPTHYEHPLVPEAGAEVIVRLDDGSRLTLAGVPRRRLEPGERVRVVVGSHGAFVL